MRALHLGILLCLYVNCFCQKETHHWFPSLNYLRIDKNGVSNLWNPFMPINLNSYYGSTSFSDQSGKYLFASDGEAVINRDNEVIISGLKGNNIPLSAAAPGSAAKHYLFYSQLLPDLTYNLRFAIIDLSVNKGQVTPNSRILDTELSRGYTICVVPNSDEFWIVTHKYKTKVFHAFKVTAAGISDNPVESITGAHSIAEDYTFDNLKTSPNGLLIAGYASPPPVYPYASPATSFLEVYNFNPVSGVISSKIKSTAKGETSKTFSSVEFSADNRLVYAVKSIFIPSFNLCEVRQTLMMQYNLCYTDPEEFTKYAIDVAEINSWCNGSALGYAQMGADRRIHFPLNGDVYFSSLNFPNRIGMSSAIDVFNLRVANSASRSGSSFNHYYVAKAVRNNIVYSAKCFPDPVAFSISNDTIIIAKWNFGDPASGHNTSGLSNPLHTFSGPGMYTVECELYDTRNNFIEKIKEVVEIKDPNKRLLSDYSRDTILCEGDFLNLNVRVVNGVFHWMHKDENGIITEERTTDNFWTKRSGTCYVEMRQNGCDGCVMYDSIKVKFVPRPKIDLEDSLEMCKGDSLLLAVADDAGSYEWSTGSTEKQIWATSAGQYWVKVVKAEGCTLRDTVTILNTPVAAYSLPSDTILCPGNKLTLSAEVPDTYVLWNDNNTNRSIEVDQSGEYWVKLTSVDGCVNNDTIDVKYLPVPTINLGADTTLKEGNTLNIGTDVSGAAYKWQNNSTSSHFLVTEPGRYWLRVSIGGCSFTDTINVDYKYLPNTLSFPNAFTPNNDGKNDELKFKRTGFYKDFRMAIYNRWGQQVFISRDPQQGWDGTIKGKVQPEGNYLWHITFTDREGNKINEKGSVLLIR